MQPALPITGPCTEDGADEAANLAIDINTGVFGNPFHHL